MNEERKPYVNSEDPELLLIRGNIENREDATDYVKKTANAILKVIEKHGKAKLRCIGAAAVNNATKSTTIARGDATSKGMHLVMEPSFVEVSFGDSGKKTGILFEVYDIKANKQ